MQEREDEIEEDVYKRQFTGFYQLQNSINLAAVHDDVRDVTAHFEACFQQLVLYGIGIKKD